MQQTLADIVDEPMPAIDRLARAYEAPSAVGGTFLVGRLAHALAVATLPLVLDGRPVPALDAATVHLTWSEDTRPRDMTLTGEPTRSRLGPELLRALTPLVEAVRTLVPVGRGGLWGMVTDGIGAAACSHGHPVLAMADAVLDDLCPLATSRPSWRTDAQDSLTLRRGVCCLAFRAPGQGLCDSCPRGGSASVRGSPTPQPPAADAPDCLPVE